MSSYAQQLTVDASLAVILAVGLGVAYGNAGILSLCHAAFFGAGAYAAAVVSVLLVVPGHPSVAISVVAGILAATACAAIVGAICLPLRGDFVALATLAFGELARAAVLNSEWLGASRGVRGIPLLTTPSMAVMLAVGSVVAARFFLQSPWGRMMEAGRDNETWADSLALPRQKARLAALLFGGALAGSAGALFAHYQQYIHPNSFGVMPSIMVLLAVILGGRGNLTGAVIGGVIVVLLPEALRFYLPSSADWRALGVGALLLLTAGFWPHGLLGRWPYRDPFRRAPRRQGKEMPSPASDDPADQDAGILKVRGLTVRGNGSAIVEDVALMATSVSPLALIGPNGSGKTTLGRAVAGDIPAEGSVAIGSTHLGHYPRSLAERRLMLCTTQHPTGFPNLTALDNIRVVVDREFRCSPWLSWLPVVGKATSARSAAEARDALSWVDLSDRAEVLFRDLSYGQRKRVILAAALLARPAVLILDEPFAGLNTGPGSEAERITEALRARLSRNDQITIAIDHRVQMLEPLCKSAALMDGGRILLEGPLGEVLGSPRFEETYGRERA